MAITAKAKIGSRVSVLVSSDDFSTPSCLRLLEGFHEFCRERGWVVHTAGLNDLASAMTDFSPAAVLFPLCTPGDSVVRLLRRRVVISAGHDQTKRGWASVVPDDREAGRQAARYLLGLGFRSLAAFGGWDHAGPHEWAVRRVEGFAEAAGSAKIAIDRFGERIDPATGQREEARFRPEHTRRWVAALPRHTGVLVPCDAWGHILTSECRELGRPVPEDIAIVGIDNIQAVCELCDPPISSVAIAWERMGQLAAELIAYALKGKPRTQRLITVPAGGVMVRRSSDTLAVADPDVAAALRIIHAHGDKPLRVSDIFRQVPVTQRRLERHFKRHLGRRIVEEIRRVRIEKAKELLADVDLPMTVIARRCGYSSAPRFNAAFRSETGTTPSKFRRRPSGSH